jgi:hypothetical protein
MNVINSRDGLLEGHLIRVRTLGWLRKELLNKDRLGQSVLRDVSERLRQLGVTAYPRQVLEHNDEPRQEQELRLVSTDSNLGRIVAAVCDPTVEGDKFLEQLASDRPAQAAEELVELRSEAGAVARDLDDILTDARPLVRRLQRIEDASDRPQRGGADEID